MEKKADTNIINRILRISVISQIILIIFIYFFTNNYLYCIITILAAIIGITGFVIMIKSLDKCLSSGRKKAIFFITGFVKLIVISLAFILISRISETAVLFYLLGLSVIVISAMIEGAYQIYRSFSNGT